MPKEKMMVIVLEGGKKYYNPKSKFLKWHNLGLRNSFSLLQIDEMYKEVQISGLNVKLMKTFDYINISKIVYVYELDTNYELVNK